MVILTISLAKSRKLLSDRTKLSFYKASVRPIISDGFKNSPTQQFCTLSVAINGSKQYVTYVPERPPNSTSRKKFERRKTGVINKKKPIIISLELVSVDAKYFTALAITWLTNVRFGLDDVIPPTAVLLPTTELSSTPNYYHRLQRCHWTKQIAEKCS